MTSQTAPLHNACRQAQRLTMRASDWIIGPAEEGGRIVAEGLPEKVALREGSATGRFLSGTLRAL